jgi:hypothetical protein
MEASTALALQVAFAVAIVIFTAYAAGRVHQWSRHGLEREIAYRDGYNQASHALFHLAIRTLPGKSPQIPQPFDTLDSLNDREVQPTRIDRIGAR